MNKVTLKYEKTTFFAAMIAGLFAHGYVYTHNLQIHDNVYNFYLGGTLNLGRWMLFLCNVFMNKLNGNYFHYQAPLYLGLLSLVFTALAAGFVCNLFKLKNKLSSIALGAIMVSFPAMTSMYAYMFTAALYSLGLLLTVIGSWLICTRKKWYEYLLGIVAIACGVGMYQSYISVFLSLFVMHFFVEVMDDKEKKAKKTVFRALYYIASTFLSMLLYYVVLMLCLWRYKEELSTYRGISEGSSGISVYLKGAIQAYTYFLAPLSTGTDNMYQNSMLIIYMALVILSFAAVMFLVIKKFTRYPFGAVAMFICASLLPLGFNFIYVMVPEGIYSLMMYGEVFFFVWLVIVAENVEYEIRDMKQIPIKRIMSFAFPVMVILFAFMYARISNICYLKADEMQTAATSYFNRLVLKIESVEGYSEDTPVLFVNYNHEADSTVFGFDEFDRETWIYPYNIESMTNDYNWENFMVEVTGWQPGSGDIGNVSASPEIEVMPDYPAEGSVRMIDGVVVVKFKEAKQR